MKLIQFIISLIAFAFVMSTYANSHQPKQVPIGFEKLYVANGFDDNDNVQLVGEGYFPDSCYRSADVKATVDHVKKIVRVKTTAFLYEGICLTVILPFDRVVDLGILNAGIYKVVRDIDSVEIGRVGIKASLTKDADDYLYAPVSQAFFLARDHSNKVSLTGDFPSSCMRLKEVRHIVQPDVLVIQPIAEIDPKVKCAHGKFHFETTLEIGEMKSGRYLLHVRSMNGKAINSLVDVP